VKGRAPSLAMMSPAYAETRRGSGVPLLSCMLRPRGWTTFLPIRFRQAILPRGLPGSLPASVPRVRRRGEIRRHALNSDRTPSSFHIEPRRFIVKRRRNAQSRRSYL
jgi:hypothetical protein